MTIGHIGILPLYACGFESWTLQVNCNSGYYILLSPIEYTVRLKQVGKSKERINMYCKDCGMDIGNGSYCGNCGSGLLGLVPNNGQYVTGRRKVNKLAFGMLALFTGSMGLHRFYSGKKRSGIMYLLFFWTLIPSFLGFIEGIIALTKDDDGSCNIEVDPDKFFI